MRILKIILYGVLGFMLSNMGLTITDLKFWIILAIVIGIECLTFFIYK